MGCTRESRVWIVLFSWRGFFLPGSQPRVFPFQAFVQLSIHQTKPYSPRTCICDMVYASMSTLIAYLTDMYTIPFRFRLRDARPWLDPSRSVLCYMPIIGGKLAFGCSLETPPLPQSSRPNEHNASLSVLRRTIGNFTSHVE